MERTGLTNRLASLTMRWRTAVIGGTVLLTALLAIPFLFLDPAGTASDEPGGPVFEARDAIEERLDGEVHSYDFIVEAQDGNLLDKADLRTFRERILALRAHPEIGPLLVPQSAEQIGERGGVVTIADLVRERLGEQAERAPNDEWREAASSIVDQAGPAQLGLSVESERDPRTGRWRVPATVISVQTDREAIERLDIEGAATESERFEHVGRDIQEVLRGSQSLDVWGIAIDQDLTAAEQGEATGPFIGLTVFALLLLVGITFRSYWVLAVTGGGLIALIIWLNGLANLVGMKEHQILSTVVPIAMLAFGVDYVFHAVGRYREKQEAGHTPDVSYRRGLAAVGPALGLALATGAAAFLANTASGIESIVQFGITATIGLIAAFLLLGYIVPLVLTMVDTRRSAVPFRWSRPTAVAGGLGAAASSMAAVLMLVFASQPIGLALAAIYPALFISLPLWLAGRMPARHTSVQVDEPGARAGDGGEGWLPRAVGRLVVALAVRRRVVLPLVGVFTLVTAVSAAQVPASFDVEDFFARDTDFVVGLEKVDEHVGDQGGEEADIFIEADLSNPDSLTAIQRFVDRVRGLDSALLARDADGDVRIEGGVLAVIEGAEQARSGNLRTDPKAVGVAVHAATQAGTGEQLTVTSPPGTVSGAIAGDGPHATRLQVRLVGSREQENIAAARELLEPLVDDLEADLRADSPEASATLTGTPIVRQASMDAVSRALQISLPIALGVCFLLTAAFMRSIRYALVASGSILLVAAWLYGFMYWAGFSVNLVTATIGALSIGIGIDFATHFTMRYREELGASGDRVSALERTARGTGAALMGSTISSALGFAILALAPMPMFASFGLLTALMVVFALLASLIVLPGLLLVSGRQV